MNDAEKLTKIIEYAVECGWDTTFKYLVELQLEVRNMERLVRYHLIDPSNCMDDRWEVVSLNGIIFDHDFCKAYFPTAKCLGCIQSNEELENWQYQIQQLALSDNRIEYLWQFYNEGV